MTGKPTYEELEQKITGLENEVSGHRHDIGLLKADHTRLQAILESAIHAIIVVNDRAQIIEWPSQAELLCGWSRDEIIGKPIFSLMPSRLRKKHKGFLHQVLGGNLGENFGKRIETNILYRDEFEVPVELAVSLTRVGDRQELTVFMHDITERKNYEAQLHHMSITDELTGLFNRRGFMTLADQQMKVSSRNKDQLFLLYADFDNMKWINDNLGHQVGDNALVETAVILKNTFRQADLIGRVGGDEFIVMITNRAEKKNEATVIKRLESELKKANALKHREYTIQLSMGTVKCNQKKVYSIEELMVQADQQMYECKKEKKESGSYNYS
ncbi:MAG: sensor domain-containing diguanylate cyclase [Thermodesulfobacteriota bacterium]